MRYFIKNQQKKNLIFNKICSLLKTNSKKMYTFLLYLIVCVRFHFLFFKTNYLYELLNYFTKLLSNERKLLYNKYIFGLLSFECI